VWYYKNVIRLTTQGCNNIVTLLEQPCNKSDININKVVRTVNKLFHTCYNNWECHDITRMLQGCDNIVMSYRTCWNNLATSLIIIINKVVATVNNLFHTCRQLGESSANTTCWRLVGRLATRCESFTCVHLRPIYTIHNFCLKLSHATCSQLELYCVNQAHKSSTLP
jgi:hypothetical protein